MGTNKLVCLLAVGATLGLAQSPDLSGVWKANFAQSSLDDPSITSYAILLEQSAGGLKETADTVNRYGPYRSITTYQFSGREARGSVHGIPARIKAAWEGGALVVDMRIFNTQLETLHKTYRLAGDGKTLTIETSGTREGRPAQSKVIFEKQPDAAGAMLRQPEQTAAQRFKNVQLLKDVPASRFIDAMHYFTLSVGGDCETCHMHEDFASDANKHKVTARKMITMTRGINEQYFEGKNEVRCYSCHHGMKHPQIAPMPKP